MVRGDETFLRLIREGHDNRMKYKSCVNVFIFMWRYHESFVFPCQGGFLGRAAEGIACIIELYLPKLI